MISGDEDALTPSKGDLILSGLFIGFFVGFGYFALCHTVLETRRAQRFAPHVIFCWGEIIACVAHAVLSYLHLVGVIGPTFGLFFGMVTAWTFQVHCLLQIIVNRVSVLLSPLTRAYLKFGIAGLWTMICISVYCVWIPAQLRVNPTFEIFNYYWDRTEKSIYFLTDAALNYYFIHTVKLQLVQHGLTKYDEMVKFNQCIVFVSLATDVLLIGLMNLLNTFIYTQFQSVAFIIKLDVEIAMFRLIAQIAHSAGITDHNKLHITNHGIGSVQDHVRTPSRVEVHVVSILEIEFEETEPDDAKKWDRREDHLGNASHATC